jgi:hypothetical protein
MIGRALFSPHRRLWYPPAVRIWSNHFASLPSPSPDLEPDPTTSNTRSANEEGHEQAVTMSEAKRLMRLVNVEALKKKLGESGGEVIPYNELLHTCESMGVARTSDEAVAFARALDETGVVLLFRDKVYLHPAKVIFFFLAISVLLLFWELSRLTPVKYQYVKLYFYLLLLLVSIHSLSILCISFFLFWQLY